MSFELTTLDSYDDDALLEEIRRVVGALPPGPVTRATFDRHSRVATSTLVRRFGGWREALHQAGVGDRYFGRAVSQKMRRQQTKALSDEELLADLRAAARTLGTATLTMEQFSLISRVANAAGIKRRFGSWKSALERASLRLSPLGRRFSDDDYFDNILVVWAHYGRQPTYPEMDAPPSFIQAGAYEAKFGGWRKALAAFVARMNADRTDRRARPRPTPTHQRSPGPADPPALPVQSIPVGLRYDVFRRDHFKCVLCGGSPATNPRCQLHVDHILPRARGGATIEANLRTLCSRCNIGKRDKIE